MRKIVFTFSSLLLLCTIACNNVSNDKKNDNITTLPNQAETQTSPKKFFIPGKSFGTIKLGENATATLDSLGKPVSSDAGMGKMLATWKLPNEPNAEISLFTTMKMGVEDFRRIQMIRSTSSEYKSKSGLGVGSKLSAIKKQFKLSKVGDFEEKNTTYSLFDSEKGIAFEITADSIVSGVVLYKIDAKNSPNFNVFYDN